MLSEAERQRIKEEAGLHEQRRAAVSDALLIEGLTLGVAIALLIHG